MIFKLSSSLTSWFVNRLRQKFSISHLGLLDILPYRIIHLAKTLYPVFRNLGTIMDRHLTMTSHVNNIFRHASLALRNIGRVRKYITQSSTERLVFITSKLDCCNSLLYGLPSTEVQRLQRIQNTAARLVVKAKRTDHTSPILQRLH